MDSYNSPTTKPLYHIVQVIWFVAGILEVFLLFRFFLKLLGANPSAEFTGFIYRVTYAFASPFLNVFGVTPVESGGIFEWTSLLAMFVYWLIALGIIRLLLMGKTVSTPEAAIKLEQHES